MRTLLAMVNHRVRIAIHMLALATRSSPGSGCFRGQIVTCPVLLLFAKSEPIRTDLPELIVRCPEVYRQKMLRWPLTQKKSIE